MNSSPKNHDRYIFTSERLGFRNWNGTDVVKMTEINADAEVMQFFPRILSPEETATFIERMKNQFAEKGFCYFAVDKLENEELIGCIGISEQTYESDFTPCIDIGWRLAKKEWNKGYATEGAKRCLRFAFEEMNLPVIKSVAPALNKRSEQVMKKIGMKKLKNFYHPLLEGNERLRECVLYEITNG
ncbi:MAG: GNAT family N-acetyltransferase [Bacteroidota bacterium]|nr:GNAT family N-acetyltransferase [Bacteroidota bacterium]